MNTGKRSRRQKLLSILLCICLLATSFPAMAFAESEVTETNMDNGTSVTTTEEASEDSITEASGEELTSLPETEIESLREETIKHFLNVDGSFTAVNYMTPVHYQEETGGE